MQVFNFFKSLYKKKRKYENLDLDYITHRIIAMSYPGDTIKEILIHNNINEIINHLKKYHNNNYQIYNLSGIPYAESKFDNMVKLYNWKDHHAPPLFELVKVCFSIKDYLNIKNEHVVCIHCLAGKGRTGVVICCLLIMSNLFDSIQDILDYFSIKRKGDKNLGVQQSGQLRYINFFNYLLYSPQFKGLNVKCYEIEKIVFSGLSENEINSFYVKIESYYHENGNKIINNNSIYDNSFFFTRNNNLNTNNDNNYNQNNNDKYIQPMNLKGNYVLCGDFVIYVIQNSYYNPILCWICYHTFLFNENTNIITFTIKDIDPHTLHNNVKYKNLKIELIYKPFNDENNNETLNYIINNERMKMNKLNSVIQDFRNIEPNEKKRQGHKLLFGQVDNDINQVLKK